MVPRRVRRLAAALLAAAAVLACTPDSPASSAGTLPTAPADGAFARGRSAAVPGRPEIGLQRNGRAFVQDNLWTTGDEQYAVWVDEQGRPIAGKRALGDDAWTTFDLSTVTGNPLAAPTASDNHNVYAIAVDADGYVHVAGNMHADPLRYVRSLRPGDVTSWTAPGMVGADESSVTYPTFARRADGTLLFFYRQGGSGQGDVLVNALDPGSGRWRRQAELIDGDSSRENAYLQHVAVDRRTGVIHVMFVWRGTPEATTNNDLSYARSDDGGITWTTAAGEPLALPLTHATAEVALDTPVQGSGLSNSGGLEVDADGHPHAAVLLHEPGAPNSVVHVWHDGTAWRRETVLTRIAGRLRPAVVTTSAGDVLVLHADGRRAGQSTVWLLDVTPGRERVAPVPLFEVASARWEPVFDTQGLYRDDALHVLTPGAAGDCTTATSGTVRCSGPSVVTFDLTQVVGVSP